MAVYSYVLTLSGSAQQLSTLTNATTEPLRTMLLQPGTTNAAAVRVGGSNVSSTIGLRIPPASGGEPPAPWQAFDTQSQYGHSKLSDWYVYGTNAETLQVTVVTM